MSICIRKYVYMYVCIYARICSYKYISTCDACVTQVLYRCVCGVYT